MRRPRSTMAAIFDRGPPLESPHRSQELPLFRLEDFRGNSARVIGSSQTGMGAVRRPGFPWNPMWRLAIMWYKRHSYSILLFLLRGGPVSTRPTPQKLRSPRKPTRTKPTIYEIRVNFVLRGFFEQSPRSEKGKSPAVEFEDHRNPPPASRWTPPSATGSQRPKGGAQLKQNIGYLPSKCLNKT